MPQAKKAPEVYLFHPPSPEPAETGSFPLGTLRMLTIREQTPGRDSSRRGLGLMGVIKSFSAA